VTVTGSRGPRPPQFPSRSDGPTVRQSQAGPGVPDPPGSRLGTPPAPSQNPEIRAEPDSPEPQAHCQAARAGQRQRVRVTEPPRPPRSPPTHRVLWLQGYGIPLGLGGSRSQVGRTCLKWFPLIGSRASNRATAQHRIMMDDTCQQNKQKHWSCVMNH
jgi:hypothetical protein